MDDTRTLLPPKQTSSRHYRAQNDGSVWDVFRHFSSRGHTGPVQCLACSQDMNYVISGGADYTMRVWRYSYEYEAYHLYALTQHAMPKGTKDVEPEQGFLCKMICPKAKDWAAQRRGVTAVGMADSKYSSLRVGEAVVLDPDADFVAQAFDHLDLPWDDAIEGMLGEKFNVVEVNDDAGTFGLPSPNTGDVLYFPGSCLTREKEPTARMGPFISATAHGDVCVLCIHSGPRGTLQMFSKLHTGAVNALCVLATGKEHTDFLVLSAGDDGDAAILRLRCEERSVPSERAEEADEDEDEKLKETELVLVLAEAEELHVDGVPLRLKHEIDGEPTPVLQAKHVGEQTNEEAVTFVTLARDGAYVWNIGGQLLMKLTVQKQILHYDAARGKDQLIRPDIQEYHHLGVVNKDNGSLLLVSGRGHKGVGYTAVWTIQEGLVRLPNFATLDKHERLGVWAKARAKYNSTGDCPVPIAAYQRDGGMIDCDQAGDTTSFAVEVDMASSYRVMLWNLLAISPERLVLEPPDPAGLLIMPGREKILMTLRHTAKVCSLKAVEDASEGMTADGTGGAAVITGCEDGCIYAWDVDGQDSRQVYAQMRSLGFLETILPPLILILSSIQIMSFAFGPAIPWQRAVHKPAAFVHRIVMFDVSMSVRIPKEAIFWPEIIFTFGLMTFFILSAASGAVFFLDGLVHGLQDTRCFKHEKQNIAGPCHLLLIYVRRLRQGLTLLMQFCSTILVVPMFQVCARALDCVYPPGEPPHLEDVPAVVCNTGPQLKLQIAIYVILPMYFFVLIPFSSVGGDPFYVPRSTLYDYKVWEPENMWRAAARRKATDVYMGVLHRTPGQAFLLPVTELIAKCILPFATAELTQRPLCQMALVSFVGTFMYIQCVVFPPYMEAKFLVLVQDLRLMTMIAMLIGVLVALLGKLGIREAMLPVWLLGISISAILCHLTYKLCTLPLKRHRVQIFLAQSEESDPDMVLAFSNVVSETGDLV